MNTEMKWFISSVWAPNCADLVGGLWLPECGSFWVGWGGGKVLGLYFYGTPAASASTTGDAEMGTG